MAFILTLVAASSAHPLTDRYIGQSMEIIESCHIKVTGAPTWLAKAKAAEVTIARKPDRTGLMHLREALFDEQVDIFITPAVNRRKKLLLADMESTIVDAEALDELAAFAGIKDKIAAITKNAMEGKLDFIAALKERVGLLKGLPADTLDKVMEKMILNPGARELTATMKKHGAKCVLVSGGFTFFTEPVAKKSGFDAHHGNVLEVANGKLTGGVLEPILDKKAKFDFMHRYIKELELTTDDVLSIGDGANDIPMLKAAGLGIGYRPKEAVAAEIDNLIIHGDLSAALYAQGYASQDLAN